MKKEYVYCLKQVKPDMTSYNNFKWKKKGKVIAPDWKLTKECGNGLHAFLNGEGDGSLADYNPDNKWLVLKVEKSKIIDLSGKVKFPECTVTFCGTIKEATDKLIDMGIKDAIIGASITSGDYGTSTSGYGGVSTSGYGGTSTSGDYGTSTSGDYGTSTSGDYGIIQIVYFLNNRKRIKTGYIGENGLKANVKYQLNDEYEFEEA